MKRYSDDTITTTTSKKVKSEEKMHIIDKKLGIRIKSFKDSLDKEREISLKKKQNTVTKLKSEVDDYKEILQKKTDALEESQKEFDTAFENFRASDCVWIVVAENLCKYGIALMVNDIDDIRWPNMDLKSLFPVKVCWKPVILRMYQEGENCYQGRNKTDTVYDDDDCEWSINGYRNVQDISVSDLIGLNELSNFKLSCSPGDDHELGSEGRVWRYSLANAVLFVSEPPNKIKLSDSNDEDDHQENLSKSDQEAENSLCEDSDIQWTPLKFKNKKNSATDSDSSDEEESSQETLNVTTISAKKKDKNNNNSNGKDDATTTNVIVKKTDNNNNTKTTEKDNEKQQKEIMYIKVTELNGWEHEEWFRYYPVESKDMEIWSKLCERLKSFNKMVSDKRWKAIMDENKQQSSKPSIYASYGFPTPIPSVVRCDLSEFHIDIKTPLNNNKIDKLVDSESSHDDDDSDEEKDEMKLIREERAAFNKGDSAFRKYFYKIGSRASYTHKHKKCNNIDINLIQELATTDSDDRIQEAFYKNNLV